MNRGNSPLKPGSSEPQYFDSPPAMRRWLKTYHKTARELVVGYYKAHAKKAGKKSLTWPESVAEALCFGWIDGIRRSVDADRYTIRFTPRRPTSTWSEINIRMMADLEAAGRMTEAGRAVFRARREPKRTGKGPLKQICELDATCTRKFRRHKQAWSFFESQPPGYRKRMVGWVMHAKRDETRMRRLATLIELSEAGKRAM